MRPLGCVLASPSLHSTRVRARKGLLFEFCAALSKKVRAPHLYLVLKGRLVCHASAPRVSGRLYSLWGGRIYRLRRAFSRPFPPFVRGIHAFSAVHFSMCVRWAHGVQVFSLRLRGVTFHGGNFLCLENPVRFSAPA